MCTKSGFVTLKLLHRLYYLVRFFSIHIRASQNRPICRPFVRRKVFQLQKKKLALLWLSNRYFSLPCRVDCLAGLDKIRQRPMRSSRHHLFSTVSIMLASEKYTQSVWTNTSDQICKIQYEKERSGFPAWRCAQIIFTSYSISAFSVRILSYIFSLHTANIKVVFLGT